MISVDQSNDKLLRKQLMLLPLIELNEVSTDGKAEAKIIRAALDKWKLSNAQYTPNKQLLARNLGKNALLWYIGLQPTSFNIKQVDAWQVFDNFNVRCELDVLLALDEFLFMDPEDHLSKAATNLGDVRYWATAICRLSDGASIEAMTLAYSRFATALRFNYWFKSAHLELDLEELRNAERTNRKELRGKPADRLKARALRKAIDDYRLKHPKYSRDKAATDLAARKEEIRLGKTRIKEYFNFWFTEAQWPRGTTGPKPKAK